MTDTTGQMGAWRVTLDTGTDGDVETFRTEAEAWAHVRSFDPNPGFGEGVEVTIRIWFDPDEEVASWV